MFKTIVVPVDLSDKHSLKAILPFTMKSIRHFDAKVHFVYIIPDFGTKVIEDYLPKTWLKDQKTKHEKEFDKIIKQYIPEDLDYNIYISRGAIYDEVIQYANDIKADLIVISAVRPQFKDYMLGPNASKIVRHAGISVLVLRD